jgi:hypothetical protein
VKIGGVSVVPSKGVHCTAVEKLNSNLYTFFAWNILIWTLVVTHVFSVVEQLGGKQLVMTLLSHDDPNVRYEALLAVQKLMVHNWYAQRAYFINLTCKDVVYYFQV